MEMDLQRADSLRYNTINSVVNINLKQKITNKLEFARIRTSSRSGFRCLHNQWCRESLKHHFQTHWKVTEPLQSVMGGFAGSEMYRALNG